MEIEKNVYPVTDVKSNLTVGIIGGFGGQAKRLVGLYFREHNDYSYILFDHASKDRFIEDFDYEITNNLADLFECDCIMIFSPTASHSYYLEYLHNNNYKGYIYCEKPAIQTEAEAEIVMNYPLDFKHRTMFGFNLRFGILEKIVSGCCSVDIGNPLQVNIISGHGLGYKDFYSQSWRNDPEKMKYGIFETVGIHYIDLFARLFGEPTSENLYASISAPGGKVADTVSFTARFGSGVILNLFLSYVSPLIERNLVICTDGIVEMDNNSVQIYSPRDYFDSNGFFANPPLADEIESKQGFWNDSMKGAMEFFFEHVENQTTFDELDYNSAIQSSKMLWKVVANANW